MLECFEFLGLALEVIAGIFEALDFLGWIAESGGKIVHWLRNGRTE